MNLQPEQQLGSKHCEDASHKESYALIMKGGGVKGLAYIGALKVLMKHYQFNWFVGTSAGAIAASFLAAGFTVDELEEVLREKSFSDFLDSKLWWLLYNLITTGGLFPGKTVRIWVGNKINEKLNSADPVKLNHDPNIPGTKLKHRLTIYASTTNRKALVFDSSAPASAEVEVAYAVRCSMSMPFLFTPPTFNGAITVDGGIQNNYPVEALLEHYPDTKFVGLYLGPEVHTVTEKQSNPILAPLFDQVRSLFAIVLDAADRQALMVYREHTVIIDTRPIKTTDFFLSNEEKDFLIKTGQLAALKYLMRKNHPEGPSEVDLNNAQAEVNEAKKLIERLRAKRQRLFRLKLSLLALSVLLVIAISSLVAFSVIRKSLSSKVTISTSNLPENSGMPNSASQGQRNARRVSVLIADFDGPDPEQYGVPEILKKGIEDLPSKYPDLKVERLREVLDSKDSAERRGRELNANIVIWGNYIANKSHAEVTAYFTMVERPAYVPDSTDKKTIRSSIADLLSFTVQDKLSNRMRYLILFTSGLTFYVAHDYAEAIKRLDNAIAVPQNESDSYVSYFFRGTAHGFNDNYQAAIKDLTKCIRLRPRTVEAYNNLGIAFAEIDQPKRAIELFREAIEIEPEHVNAYINLGGAYFDKGWHKQAADEFSKALKYDPTNLRALMLLAEAQYKLGNDDAALRTLNEASRLGEDLEYYTLLGALYLRSGNFALAVSNLQKALSLAPEAGIVHGNLARAYAEQGNSDQAVFHYTKAIQTVPTADYYHDRGLANFSIGCANEAAADFKKAIELNATLADAYSGLSYTYLVLGQGLLAAEAADHYLRLSGWQGYRAPYMALVIYFGLKQSSKTEDAERILKKAAQHCEKSVWPCPIVNYLRRSLTLREVLEQAYKPKQIGTAITTNNREIGVYTPAGRRLPTEAHTYVALDLALAGDTNQAYFHLRWVHDNGERQSFEYQLALSKLDQLKK